MQTPLCDTAETLPPTRPALCPRCGYSFEGLPAEGKCPECGLLYDRNHIILFGWGRSAATARSSATLIISCLAAVLIAMLLIVDTLPPITYPPSALMWRRIPWPYLAIAAGGGAFLIGLTIKSACLRRRYHRIMPAPVQLRLSCDGYAFREGLGDTKLRRWKPTIRVELRRRSSGLQRLSLRCPWEIPHLCVDLVMANESAAQLASQIRNWIARSSGQQGGLRQ
jgi:hypothetical protein